MKMTFKQLIKKTNCFSGMLICFIFLLFSCITDKIDEESGTRTDEDEGVICFKSTFWEFDALDSKGAKTIQATPCPSSKWDKISVEVTPMYIMSTTKGTPIHSSK